jgi:hypothetical protein
MPTGDNAQRFEKVEDDLDGLASLLDLIAERVDKLEDDYRELKLKLQQAIRIEL